MANNPIMETTTEEKKTFTYNYADIPFNVTLRVDIKEQLKNFLVILDRAREDIIKEIETRFPKQ